MSATTRPRPPRRIVLSDGKGRPSWASPEVWIAYERVNAQAAARGFDTMACGWSFIGAKRHGEYRVGRAGTNESITVTADSPAMAIMSMEFLLDRLEDADTLRDRP